MTVRRLLGSASIAAVVSLLGAGNAFAQYTFSTTSPSVGTVLATVGATNVQVTAVSTDSSVPLTIGSLTPFFNFNKTNNTAAGGWSSGPITLTVTAKKNNVAALNSQTLIFTASGQLLTTGSGATTVTSVSPNYNTASFVFNFGDGSTLTLSQFGRSNATGFIGNVGSSDGIFGFNSSSEFVPNVAPEPGSMALVATGLMSTLGMVAVRRRKAA